MKKRVVIIGAGVGGLASACLLGQAGYNVIIAEKNSHPGGVAAGFEANGFKFDGGPSWYLMPEVFEKYFSLLGEDATKLFKPKKLDPSYRIFLKDSFLGNLDIKSDPDYDGKTFESLEPGAKQKLNQYLANATAKYNLATDKFLYKNYDSPRNFLTPSTYLQGFRMNAFSNMRDSAAKYFTNSEIQKLMLFPAIFLGTKPNTTPALYDLLNHALFKQGVYYPKGGFRGLVNVLVELAESYGVKIICDSPVTNIKTSNHHATGVVLENGQEIDCDIVVSNAGIPHTELKLLKPADRSYSKKYFAKSKLAPSALLIYLGVKKQYPHLRHHNLLFSKDWEANLKSIFDGKRWPGDPSIYICNPNKTDPEVAPKKHENLFVLVLLPTATNYSSEDLERYADWVLETVEKTMRLDDLRQKIVYKKLFAARDFKEKYNKFNGTALGFSHTLRQSAGFRPRNQSKKLRNLYYVGSDTTPGIGLPMCLISAQLLRDRIES